MRDLLYVAPGATVTTGAIGLLVPELGNPIFPALAEEMERARDGRRARDDPLQHGRVARHARPTTSTCCSSAGSRG